jgi:hypothetical protein
MKMMISTSRMSIIGVTFISAALPASIAIMGLRLQILTPAAGTQFRLGAT